MRTKQKIKRKSVFKYVASTCSKINVFLITISSNDSCKKNLRPRVMISLYSFTNGFAPKEKGRTYTFPFQ